MGGKGGGVGVCARGGSGREGEGEFVGGKGGGVGVCARGGSGREGEGEFVGGKEGSSVCKKREW